MLNVTKEAAAILKAAKAAEGAPDDSGIRIRRTQTDSNSTEQNLVVRFAITEEPVPGDAAIEQDGLMIFVEPSLVEPLDGRTLDAREDDEEGPDLIFR